MNVSIGDALGQFRQFFCPLALQFGGHAILGNPIQQPLNVGCRPCIACALIVVVPFRAATLRCGYLTGILQRNAATLLVRHRLVCLGRVSAPRQYFRTTGLILFRSGTITSIIFRQCFSTLFIGIFAALYAGIFRGTAFCLLIFLILRGRTRCQSRGCCTLGAGSRFALRCSRTSSHWSRFASAFLTAASK